MKFVVDRETLLVPLQAVQGVVERRQTLPILANVLLSCTESSLAVTATDMEVELVARVPLEAADPGEVTVPARKFLDICRALPAEAQVDFTQDENRVYVRSGRSRFVLSTLPAGDYPSADSLTEPFTFTLEQGALKRLVELTQFAIAHQDVRYYLNGLLLEMEAGCLRAVATDGHRLALAQMAVEEIAMEDTRQVIVPRKGVVELSRILGAGADPVNMAVGTNAIQMDLEDLRLSTKLIDGRFPEYGRVIPNPEQCDKVLTVDRDLLRQSLNRASILSNEKYRAVRLQLEPGRLKIVANNPEQEEAEDEVEVDYSGDSLEIGFNVSYLIDALSALPADTARLYLSDASSSCLIRPDGREDCQYVVMPMRL